MRINAKTSPFEELHALQLDHLEEVKPDDARFEIDKGFKLALCLPYTMALFLSACFL